MDELAQRIAVWQCRPGPLDVDGNLRRLAGACAVAATRGADVLVTPEMFTTGYAITRTDVLRLAEDAGGPTEAAVAGLARRHQIGIAYGYPERAPDGAYNAATLIGSDGTVRGRHRKVHLYGEVDREQFIASPAPPAAFDVNGTRTGLLICYDVEFPEAVRHLAADGARTVLVPTANMTGCEQVQEFLIRARACENGVSIAYANYCGADDGFTYNGMSMICGPGGEVLAQAGLDGEELIVADLPAGSAGTYLADRRPELYARPMGAVLGRRLPAPRRDPRTRPRTRAAPQPPTPARRAHTVLPDFPATATPGPGARPLTTITRTRALRGPLCPA